MHRGLLVALLIVTFMSSILSARPSFAADPDVHSVIVAGEYGLVAGTVLGLASLPFSQSSRSVFIGTSVGLYLGIAVGLYYIANRDNPNNPLRMEQRPTDPEASRQDPRQESPWLSAVIYKF